MRLVIIIFFCVISTLSRAQVADSLYERGNWGIGFDFGPCTGFGFAYGEASEYVDEECYVNIGLIFIRNKIHYVARLGALSGGLNKTLPFDTTWAAGNFFQSTNIELVVGYQLMDKHRFNIVPFLSAGVKYFATSNEETDFRNSLAGKPVIGVSLAIDYKIHFPVKEKNRYPGYKETQQYLYLRLLGGVYPNYYQNEIDLNGGLSFVNFTIGGNFIPSRKKESP